MNILLIDDDPTVLSGVTLTLTLLKVNVSPVSNAKDALQALLDKPHGYFSAVVSDLRMPEISGIDLLKQLRMHHNHIPFIIVSGHITKKEGEEIKRYMCSTYLNKPIHPQELIETCLNLSNLNLSQAGLTSTNIDKF
jgi:DNA-binding NtrC family response regulator